MSTLPVTAEGMLPIKAIVEGKNESSNSPKAVGMRVNLEATPVEAITPGLKEKLTGPITPNSPDRMLPNPVNETPLVIRFSILSGRMISPMD